MHFILSGEDDETDVRVLNDTKRKVLQRGNVDVFAMTTPRSVCTLSEIKNQGIGGHFTEHQRHCSDLLLMDFIMHQVSRYINGL